MTGLLLLFTACGFEAAEDLTGEGMTEDRLETTEEAPPVFAYQAESASISEKKEAVLFQQQADSGFLALINRKTGEEIPEELLEESDFVNDGRYDVYESALFLVRENGRRDEIKNYHPMPAPPVPPEAQLYFSQSRPRAFRLNENNEIIALESSYEGWKENGTDSPFFTEDHYYIRVLTPDGEERSCHEIQTASAVGFDCDNLVYLHDGLLAIPHGQSVLFFNTDGEIIFTVDTPMRIRQLCRTEEGLLAVILRENNRQWLSMIDLSDQSVTVPQDIPPEAHLFCTGSSPDRLFCVRNTDLVSLSLSDFTLEPVVSLLAIGVDPVYIASLFVREDGSIHILQHDRNDRTGEVSELYTIAKFRELKETPVKLTLGFNGISVGMKRVIVDFNRQTDQVRIEPVDMSNMGESISDTLPDLLVLNEESYTQLRKEDKLAAMDLLLPQTGKISEKAFLPPVINALREGGDSLYRVAACFRILSMAGDAVQLEGEKSFSFDYLLNKLEMMPYGSSLYEPFYTAGHLREDLRAVNRAALQQQTSGAEQLLEQIQTFAALQPEEYNYNSYVYDPRTVESRVYAGSILLIQVKIGSLDDLKWYDAYFENGACFVGWPTEEGSASRLVFDECISVSSSCPEDKRYAAGEFVRFFLASNYASRSYGFPVLTGELNRMMDEDAAAISYQIDEDGEWVLDKEGNKIEVARSSWYSAEWRRHLYYALTAAQREKLMGLIDSSV